MSLKLHSEIVAALIAEAEAEQPHECCGLLSGSGQLISNLYRLKNIAATPATRYEADPAELFQAMQAMRQRGEELLGIYHSHPRTAAYPSTTDAQLAFYPDAVYFIVSLAAPEPSVKAFRICEGEITKVEYTVIPKQ